jgi:AmmeMemoRadiSam system protein A
LSWSFTVNTDATQRQLLTWARRAMEQAVRRQPATAVRETELTDELRSPHAAFVTLKKSGELRGCIGYMDSARPVWKNVTAAAVAAALEDSRFAPVEPGELAAIRLEISILEPPVDLPRLEDFNPQEHGIIVERGLRQALLLPKVAQEYGWSAEQVLDAVCEKAGLPAAAWRGPGTRLQIFTAVDFAE